MYISENVLAIHLFISNGNNNRLSADSMVCEYYNIESPTINSTLDYARQVVVCINKIVL